MIFDRAGRRRAVIVELSAPSDLCLAHVGAEAEKI
jgi:hypothetical protein